MEGNDDLFVDDTEVNTKKLKEAISTSNPALCRSLLGLGAEVREKHLKLAVIKGDLLICNILFSNYQAPYADSLKQALMSLAKQHKHPQLWELLKAYKDGDEVFVKADRAYATSISFFPPAKSEKYQQHFMKDVREMRLRNKMGDKGPS